MLPISLKLLFCSFYAAREYQIISSVLVAAAFLVAVSSPERLWLKQRTGIAPVQQTYRVSNLHVVAATL